MRGATALVVFAVGCTGRCACPDLAVDAERPKTRMTPRSGSIRWHVSAEGHEELVLAGDAGRLVATPESSSGRAVWIAKGARGRWMHHLELVADVNRLAPGSSSFDLVSSRCRVRYLQDGRETEADFSISEATVDSLTYAGGQWSVRVRARCTKLVSERADGRPYAESLPPSFDVNATAWAR